MTSMTKTERIARKKLVRLMAEDAQDLITDGESLRGQVPDAWYTLERDIDVREKKVKVTLWLDESVARFFRAMGNGYQPRINRILATWAQMRILDWLKGEEIIRERNRAILRADEEAWARGERPPSLFG